MIVEGNRLDNGKYLLQRKINYNNKEEIIDIIELYIDNEKTFCQDYNIDDIEKIVINDTNVHIWFEHSRLGLLYDILKL